MCSIGIIQIIQIILEANFEIGRNKNYMLKVSRSK